MGFGCRVFDNEVMNGQPLLPATEFEKRIVEERVSYIWGQTCDGVDWLTKDKPYPRMEVGEWMIYRNMGAYSKATQSRFNGFEFSNVHYINR